MFVYSEILRPSVVALAAFAVAAGALVAGYWSPLPIAVAIAVAALVCGGGNVVNDIFDYNIDKVNRPQRPLPSGRISVRNAKIYAVVLWIVAIVLALSLLNVYNVVLALFNMAIAMLYSWRLKRYPLMGNFCPSWLAASAFVFGGLLSGSVTAAVGLLFVMAFLANTGREITKAIEDMPGDRKAGYRTLPLLAGSKLAAGVAILFVVLAVVLSPLPWALGLLSANYLYAVLAADMVFIVACYALLLDAAKGQRILKLAMFVAIVAFLVGIF